VRVAAALVVVAAVTAGGSSAARAPLSSPPVSIAFFDARHGVLGTERTIETTADGGRTWRIRHIGRGPYRLVDERARNDVWATGFREYFHSSDRGLTWRRTARPPVSGAAFGSPHLGWDVKPYWLRSDTRRPWLSKTRDGGRTWHRTAPVCRFPGVDFDFAGLAHVSPMHAWIVCVGTPGTGMQPKAVLETRDGGRAWAVRACACFRPYARGRLGWPGYPRALEFTPRGDGALIQIRGLPITFTHDGGRNWVQSVGEPEVDFRLDASIVSSRRMYALTGQTGGRARLQLTTDGGRTWRVLRRWRA
jgi:photosystem II stability/assembly factor-like uncharacterized protein